MPAINDREVHGPMPNTGTVAKDMIVKILFVFLDIFLVVFSIMAFLGLSYGTAVFFCYDWDRRRFVRPPPVAFAMPTMAMAFANFIFVMIHSHVSYSWPFWFNIMVGTVVIAASFVAVVLASCIGFKIWAVVEKQLEKRLDPIFAESDAEQAQQSRQGEYSAVATADAVELDEASGPNEPADGDEMGATKEEAVNTDSAEKTGKTAVSDRNIV